ncbi:hypothetical protein G9U51_15125 [Calidifontibacter sp. DB0510]|uniref:Uncharacterized protein n=1 Tax=Metallococcus carri TaxID=1656884 RepID=A0A967B942_9MICO|nr:ribonuclease E inhibitor RraB [Metallococcus carri]NHN57101.1 hypothetical protein [Metallococcus carri]NOP39030.1 hypothetical protein [Calidifontibacter sp. DB2511S]
MIEYLMVFPQRDDAEAVADELREDDLAQVRVVRDALAGEDDSEDHDWAVHVRVDTIEDPSSAPARALSDRFEAMATERGGWLDADPSAAG